MEFDIYGVFKDVFDENLTSKAESFDGIEGNGKDVESPFDYVDLFSHDAWNINSYTEACQNICNNCVKTNERYLKFTYADILACVKVEDTSKLAATTRQNKESRRVRFSTGVSITVDSNFHQASVSEMQFETDLEEPIICDEDLIRGVPYPHTGEAENKIESAFYEDIRTVGYGRTDKYNCLTYNNPFDPRITFQGLGPKSTQDNGQTNTAIKSRMGNAFLAIGNLDDVLDNYFNGYRNHLRNICMSSETFSSRTKGDHIVCHPDTDVKRKDLKIDDGGSLQCKKLFEMIRSGQVREIWSNRNDTAKKYTAAPITQKSRVKENQTKKTVKIDNRPAKIKVQSPSSDLTECNKHTKPDLNKKGKNEKILHSSYQNRENGSAENLKQIPHGSAEMSSAPYDLSWSADCWDRSKNVTKSTHDNKLLRRAASECLAESLNGKIENDKSRTSHCADDGSLQIPIVLVPELNHQPSGDKEVTEFQHGDKIAKPRPDDVQNVKDLQNWADILFNDKLLQKDESTVDDNKEKDIDKGITKKRSKSETVEKSDKGSNKIPTLTHQEPVLEESVSTLVESNKTVRESVSTSDKTVRNIFKATTSDTTKKTSQQTALRSNRNTVAENKTHTGVQQNHPATNTGVHQIPTILTSGIQRGNHFSGYQQENYQYWASRSVLPTTFSSYHNYAGASPYPTQTVRQPPPGFTILGANRMQQTGRPNIQVNYPTPLLATTANKRMYAVPEASRQRYPQQLLNCFTSYSPYHPNCSYLSHNYNLRTGWSINMNNNNSNNDYNYNNNNNDHNNNNNSNINNNNVDFDNCNYLYGEEHHESADYSVDPLGFDSQPCNVDYPPQTYQSSMELCQDNVPIMNKSRPLRSNLIRIFPSTDC